MGCETMKRQTPSPPREVRVMGELSRRISPDTSPRAQHQHDGHDQSHPTRQHVHFACHEFLETSHAPPNIPDLREEQIRELWWQSPELLQMKRYTRYLMNKVIADSKAPSFAQGNEEWLGLDRFTAERMAHKKRAVRLILLGQHQQRTHAISDNTDEFLRTVSRRCSHWSRNMSHAVGQRLFGEVYRSRADRLAATGGAIGDDTTVAGAEPLSLSNMQNEDISNRKRKFSSHLMGEGAAQSRRVQIELSS